MSQPVPPSPDALLDSHHPVLSEAALDSVTAETLHTLAVILGQRLAAAEWMLVSAESCTGGMIAAAVTEIAGSSGWFERGYVTYSNEAKNTAIAVPMPLIVEHGAVSEPVAAAMAEGALRSSLAQIAVSVTGIAGPGGGSPDKPVGTVCFGWCLASRPAMAVTRHFSGDRSTVRHRSAAYAMQGLIRLLDAAIGSGKGIA